MSDTGVTAREEGAPELTHEASGGFNAAYAGTPPWDIGCPQPAFAGLAAAGELRGRVLDAGCGTGEHALLAAGLGLTALGVDLAPAAIQRAESKATERHIAARFLVGDVLELPTLGEQFDTVLDSGVFHVFDDDDRPRFVASVAAVIPAGGRYFLLCFNEHQPGIWGPRRVTQAELRASFQEGWRVDWIRAVTMDLASPIDGAAAWFAGLTRV